LARQQETKHRQIWRAERKAKSQDGEQNHLKAEKERQQQEKRAKLKGEELNRWKALEDWQQARKVKKMD
jgi:hypothetical protein